MWIVQWFPKLPSYVHLTLALPGNQCQGTSAILKAVRSHLGVSKLGIDNSVNTPLIAHNTAPFPMAF